MGNYFCVLTVCHSMLNLFLLITVNSLKATNSPPLCKGDSFKGVSPPPRHVRSAAAHSSQATAHIPISTDIVRGASPIHPNVCTYLLSQKVLISSVYIV